MFRQDYRINKIFLPFQKKGKKHHPSALFSAEAELRFLGFFPARLASESVAGRWKP